MKRNYRAPLKRITTIEIPPGMNPYGFRINIGHELIGPLFDEWKITNGLHPRWSPSDADRLRFESFVLEAIATYQQNVEEYLEYQLEYLKQQNEKVSLCKD